MSRKFRKIISVVSIADTKKDNTAILQPLAEVTDAYIVTRLDKKERKSVDPKVLIPYINRFKKKKAGVEIVIDPHAALARARKMANADDCILVSGSFFLAGELRTEWYSEEWILKNRRS